MEISNAKSYIINYLSTNRISISLLRLKAIIPEDVLDAVSIDRVLSELLESGKIIYTPQGIAVKPQSLAGLIDHVNDKNVRRALLQYFRGDKVEKYSALEIREKVKELLCERPRLDEDEFRALFRTYRFTQKSFTAIFSQPISTYVYLKDTSKKGKKDWREIRYDLTVEEKFKLEAIRLIKDEGLFDEDRTIPFSIAELASYLLSKHEGSIDLSDLFAEYTQFLERKSPLPPGLNISYRKFIEKISIRDDIILGKSKTIRYRKSKALIDRRIINQLKLYRYRNLYISADIIFNEMANLLEAGNIVSPYELVNFIKSFPEICDKYKIQFLKEPFLIFGDGDAIRQLIQLLSENSPITGDNLAKEYERLYGLKRANVKTRYFKNIIKYQNNGIYDIKTKTITDKQFDKLSGQLNEEWYFSEHVEILFKRRVGKLYEKYMSTNNLASLGYRETNAIIYSSKYGSLEECLEKTTWAGNTFQVSDELWGIPQVNAIIQRKVMNLQILEYAPQKFIRLKYLKKNGIHKKDLYSFIDAVHRRVDEESYFTLKSLKDEGQDLPLEVLGFGDVFYYSILKKSKKVQSRKVAETYLFRKSRKPATLADFFEYLISSLRSIDLYDFTHLLSDKYGISLSPTYIRTIVNGTQMYYDTITEKIYLDYEEYFEEV